MLAAVVFRTTDDAGARRGNGRRGTCLANSEKTAGAVPFLVIPAPLESRVQQAYRAWEPEAFSLFRKDKR